VQKTEKTWISFKKNLRIPLKQDRPDVKERRKFWKSKQAKLNINQLVFLDEGSIILAYTRLFERAPKNERIQEGIKDVRFQRKINPFNDSFECRNLFLDF
jgi:hypothetical protein